MACTYDPRVMAGLPIGMFHCPLCLDLVIAGQFGMFEATVTEG